MLTNALILKQKNSPSHAMYFLMKPNLISAHPNPYHLYHIRTPKTLTTASLSSSKPRHLLCLHRRCLARNPYRRRRKVHLPSSHSPQVIPITPFVLYFMIARMP